MYVGLGGGVGEVTGVKAGFDGKWPLRHLLAVVGGGTERPPVARVGAAGRRVFNYCLCVIPWQRSRLDGERGEIQAVRKASESLSAGLYMLRNTATGTAHMLAVPFTAKNTHISYLPYCQA